MECGYVTKTDKFYKYVRLNYFDRFQEKVHRRIDKLVEKYRLLRQDIELIKGFLEIGPHRGAYSLYLQQEGEL